jgi:sugar phosphate permease
MLLWEMLQAVGGMIGTAQATLIIHSSLAWHQVFIIPSLLAGVAAAVSFKFLRMPTATTATDTAEGGTTSDEEVALEEIMNGDTYRPDKGFSIEDEMLIQSESVQTIGSVVAAHKMSLVEIWRIPMVKEVAATYFCVNVLRYAVSMWLPIYFKAVHGCVIHTL